MISLSDVTVMDETEVISLETTIAQISGSNLVFYYDDEVIIIVFF